MLANTDGLVFVGQRIDKRALGFWQMPQGGIDPGEDPETAALRELEEETGIGADLVEIVTQASRPYTYDLPPELLGKIWGGKYRGQKQHWYLGRFHGSEADIDLEAHDPPEFNDFRWVEPPRLPELIVPFKREVYAALVAEFAPLLR
jgi:putative (di)nucleoside polyphosphate hydrolase